MAEANDCIWEYACTQTLLKHPSRERAVGFLLDHIPDPRSDRDALIAATALVHGMTVVTRNVSHFQPMGVAVVNPWQS